MKRPGLWTFLFLLAAGCMHYPPAAPLRPQQAAGAELEAYYGYPRREIHPQVTLLKKKRRYFLKEVLFEFHLPQELVERPAAELKREAAERRGAGDEKGARKIELDYSVRIDYYQAQGEGEKPAVLVSPILGGNMIVNWFAAFFASHGIHAAIVHRKKPGYDSAKSVDQTEAYLRKSVLRTRQALDWLLSRPEVDRERVGSFGISYGAIINTLLAAVDTRLRCHVIALAGGPIADVILDSEERAIKKYVRNAMRESGYTPENLREDLRKAIRSDTIALAPYVRSEDVILIIAYYDRVVGRRYSENLWRALGWPEVIYTPVGHYGTIAAVPYLKAKALKFYRKKFYPEPAPGNRGILYSREARAD